MKAELAAVVAHDNWRPATAAKRGKEVIDRCQAAPEMGGGNLTNGGGAADPRFGDPRILRIFVVAPNWIIGEVHKEVQLQQPGQIAKRLP